MNIAIPVLESKNIIEFSEGVLIDYNVFEELSSIQKLFDEMYEKIKTDIPKSEFKIIKKDDRYRAFYKSKDLFVYFILGDDNYIICKGKF